MAERINQSIGVDFSHSLGLQAQPTTKVSVLGIDGSGKSTITDSIAMQFGRDNLRIARVGLPTYTIVEGERRDPYRRLLGMVDGLQGLPGGVDIALNVFLQGRVVEPGLIRSLRPDLLIGSRDYVIDPSVYAMFYSPTLSRRPMGQRLAIMNRITGLNFRKVIFLLTVPPEVALERLERRRTLQKPGTRVVGERRAPDKHENTHSLGLLRREYDSALNEVARRTDTQIFEVDAMREPNEVADFVKGTISRFIQDTQQ